MTVAMLVRTAEETMRVCATCGIEKLVGEFQTTYQKWHLRTCRQCVLLRRKEYYQGHKEAVLTTVKEYRESNKEAVLKRARERYQERRAVLLERMKEYHQSHWKEYYQKHQEVLKQRTRDYLANLGAINLEIYGDSRSPEQKQYSREQSVTRAVENRVLYGYAKTPHERVQNKQHYAELRAKALACYGGKCECCGEARYDMLTFDHKIKTYYKDKVRGVALVYAVLQEQEECGYPNSKYRVLCWNCNTSRGYYGYCPHVRQSGSKRVSYASRHSWKVKLETITAYGGKCVFCGESLPEFLTIDHINGGDNKHRQEVGNGHRFRLWLKQQDWPKGEYRLLCACCNCSDKRNGWAERKAQEEVS